MSIYILKATFTGLITCADRMPGISNLKKKELFWLTVRGLSPQSFGSMCLGRTWWWKEHLMDRLLPLVVDKNQRAQAHLQGPTPPVRSCLSLPKQDRHLMTKYPRHSLWGPFTPKSERSRSGDSVQRFPVCIPTPAAVKCCAGKGSLHGYCFTGLVPVERHPWGPSRKRILFILLYETKREKMSVGIGKLSNSPVLVDQLNTKKYVITGGSANTLSLLRLLRFCLT